MRLRTSIRTVLLSASLLCLLPALDAQTTTAWAQNGFGPETFTRTTKGKNKFTRTFTLSDTSIPYTLLLENGAGDGTDRVAKGTVTLNGVTVFGKPLVNRRFARVALALNPVAQNEIRVTIKGGSAGDFIRLSVEPTPSTVLNDPGDQAGIAVPLGVSVDQSTHRAYIADRHNDTVFEFDIGSATISRSFSGLDGDTEIGNGGTAGVTINRAAGTIVTANQGDNTSGSIATVDLDSESVETFSLSDSEGSINPYYVAVNSNNNVAAFTALFARGARRAFFIDLASGELTTRQENVTLTSLAFNPVTNQFVFTGGSNSAPSLLVYDGAAPFQRVRQINSTAQAGSSFEKVAINTETNMAVAVNQQDRAVFVFDLARGEQVARIPINTGTVTEPKADISVNPLTNQAVVTSWYLARLTVINLETNLVMAEIPLPSGTRPQGVAIDHLSNRAVISENGLSSGSRNGSIFVVQLPEP
ncbi:MAG TPA: hypothetical protein VJQ56_11725 [Blastocatellia bacterium]|nr:hypothetical protein [Blastocatellia bacterium]